MSSGKQQATSVDGKKIGFFFGAGASIEFGIPSMTRMTEEFRTKIMKNGKRDEKKLFSDVYDSLLRFYGNNGIDLEAIMSVIIAFKEKEHLRESIGDFGLFVSDKKILKTAKTITNAIPIDAVAGLEDNFKKFVRKKVSLNRTGYDKVEKIYSNFFDEICRIVACGSDKAYGKWVFFTTNYDTALEHYWINYRDYKSLHSGFGHIDNVMNPDNLIADYNNFGYTAMILIKLHGSINWTLNKQGKIVWHELPASVDLLRRHSSSAQTIEEIMIYPLTRKELYHTPFLQFFRLLEADLNKRKYWVVIGYSFRDIVIRNMFEKALKEDKSRKIILVHPHPEPVIELFLEEVKKQIVSLKEFFGRKVDYQKTNKMIADIVLRESQ